MVNRQAIAATSIVFSLIIVIVFSIDVAKVGKKFQTCMKTKILFCLFGRKVLIMEDKRKLLEESHVVLNKLEQI